MKASNQSLWEKMWDAKTLAQFEALAKSDPDLARLVEEVAVERIWARPGLELREKSLVTLSSQFALQRWDQVKIHMESFLHMGGTTDELRAVCIHLSIYCGFPSMLQGLGILREIENK